MFKNTKTREFGRQVSVDEAIRKLERSERWAMLQAKKMQQEAALCVKSNPGRHSYMILKAEQFTNNAEQVNQQLKALIAKRDYNPGLFKAIFDLIKARLFSK